MTQPAARLTASDLIAALALPSASRVDQRIPKKMLAENGAPTATDRKLIQEHIEEATWIAAIKPGNTAVSEYRDDQRTYLELAVVSVNHRLMDVDTAKHRRLAELIHRAIPYPVVLILDSKANTGMSLAHIRWAQNEADKTVLDGDLTHAAFGGADIVPAHQQAFLAALALNQQPCADLRTLYQGWLDTLTAWQAVALTGRFELSSASDHAASRRDILRQCRELDAELTGLQKAAATANQIARQVEINQKIQALRVQRQQLAARA